MTYPPQGSAPQPDPQQPQGAPGFQPGYQQPGQGAPQGAPGYQQPGAQPGYQQPGPQQGYQQPGPGYQQPGPGYAPGPQGGVEDRQSASLAHLLGGIFSWLGALIMWLVSKDKSAFNNAEGKKALNFQIWITIAYIALAIINGIGAGMTTSSLLTTGSTGFGGLLSTLAGFAMFAVWVLGLIFGIKNFNAVKNGQETSYPISAGLIK
ncbi:hypothetical protein SAMN06309944_1756 [Micrococcales bacterium KH10]|nr:hypothetical protein SAMN06309944_1756 [Micrococcales bacterium KH10]